MHGSAIDLESRGRIINALTVYFLNENSKLGLGIEEERIIDVCIKLLDGDEFNFGDWHANEQTIFDEYYKEELSVLDYLHLVSVKLRKQLGQYATPVDIVKYILNSIGYDYLKNILSKKLLDPACGSGAFLVEAARKYLKFLKKAEVPISKWYPRVVSAIVGIDIDPVACLFARLNLSMLLAPCILEFISKNNSKKLMPLPVYCADTLKMLATEKAGEDSLYNNPEIVLKEKFDYIIGNPPYFKIKGISRELQNAFSESIYGHPNAYALFLQAGIEMLKHKGKLGFIVPRSMLSGLYFKNLRNFIETNMELKEITCITERKKIFEKVLHGTMILSLQKNKTDSRDVSISRVHSVSNDKKTMITVDKESIIQRLNGTTVWFVADSPATYRIINRIVKQHPLLSCKEVNCQARTGQIVWNRVKPLLSNKQGNKKLPLVWSTDVGKFSFAFNKAGKSRPSYLIQDKKISKLIFNEKVVLVQRVTADEQPSRIVASLPEEFYHEAKEGYFVENHLNIVQIKNNEIGTDLYFILGILNSEIVEFFFRAMNGNTQVSATELNLLPVPKGSFESDISSIAKKIQMSSGHNKTLIFKLNQVVARAYGLTKKDLAFIKEFLYSGNRNEN